ncbi:NAD-dependent epimerase/dehydratase family protein [Haliangium sp.]|uniref:NAD-dependent epimerase/dehydratase family protein n=1 Tax=Haliangium sp. TaxID=2663208 RepID=UPI003D10EEBD
MIGAGGHIGNAVLRALCARGWEVSALGRRAVAPVNLSGLGCRYVVGDAGRADELDRWVSAHEVVVDAAAPYPLNAFDAGAAAAAVARTDVLVAAALRHGRRLLYVSSFATRPERRAGDWRARTARRLHPYFAAKERLEAVVTGAVERGLGADLLNPTLCLGPWDLKPRSLCLVPMLLSGALPAVLDHVVDVIDVRDVGEAAARVLERPARGTPMALSGHSLGLEALCRWICDLGGVSAPRRRVGAGLGMLSAYGAEAVMALTSQESPWPALGPMLVCAHAWMQPSREQLALGVTPRPLSQTLADSIAWYRAQGYC